MLSSPNRPWSWRNQDLKSFQDTVDISEARYKAGDIGEDDLLKMKLQLLQFQMDVSAAQSARVQGLSDLRQLLGYESVGCRTMTSPDRSTISR